MRSNGASSRYCCEQQLQDDGALEAVRPLGAREQHVARPARREAPQDAVAADALERAVRQIDLRRGRGYRIRLEHRARSRGRSAEILLDAVEQLVGARLVDAEPSASALSVSFSSSAMALSANAMAAASTKATSARARPRGAAR